MPNVCKWWLSLSNSKSNFLVFWEEDFSGIENFIIITEAGAGRHMGYFPGVTCGGLGVQQKTGPGPCWSLEWLPRLYVMSVLWRDPGQLMFLGTSDSGLRGLGKIWNLELFSLLEQNSCCAYRGGFGLWKAWSVTEWNVCLQRECSLGLH